PAPEPHMDDYEYNLLQGTQMSLEVSQEYGQAHVNRVAICEPAPLSTRKLPVVEVKGKGSATDAQARWIIASQDETTVPSVHVALAGPYPEHIHDVFLATNYPKVHESL
ncbi:hypothetical protein Tco_1051059, partial [Tanacetum coccineum]